MMDPWQWQWLSGWAVADWHPFPVSSSAATNQQVSLSLPLLIPHAARLVPCAQHQLWTVRMSDSDQINGTRVLVREMGGSGDNSGDTSGTKAAPPLPLHSQPLHCPSPAAAAGMTLPGTADHTFASAPPAYAVYADPSAQPFNAINQIAMGGPIPALPAELAGGPAAPLRVVGQPRGYHNAAALSVRANTIRTRLQSADEVVALQASIDVARRHGRHGAAGTSGARGSSGSSGSSGMSGGSGGSGGRGQDGQNGSVWNNEEEKKKH